MANLAGVDRRIAAVIVDYFVIGVITMALAWPTGLYNPMMASLTNPLASISAMIGLSALNFLLILLYFTYLEGSSGQTLGKRLVSIKVTKENGKKLTFVDAFIRSLLRIVDSIPSPFYLIGFILVLATEKKQRVGDIAAGTLVVKA